MRIFDDFDSARPLKNTFGALYFVDLFFSMISYTFIGLTTFSYINLYNEKGKVVPTVEEVWAYVKYFFIRFFIAQIALSIFIMLGFVLCLIPGIYLLPIVMIMQAMLVFENASLGYVFDRSFKLIKGNWWPSFGALAVITIVVYALFMIFALPFSILTGISMAITKSAKPLPFTFLMTFFSHLLEPAMALFYVVSAFVYFSIVEKKEGASLMDKIEMIGKDNDASDLPEEQY